MPSSVLISTIHAQQAALHDIHLPHDDFSQIHLHVNCGVVHELRVCEVLPYHQWGPKKTKMDCSWWNLLVKCARHCLLWKWWETNTNMSQIQDEEKPTVSPHGISELLRFFSWDGGVYLMSIIGELFFFLGDVSYTTCENNNIIDTHDRYIHVSPTRTISEVCCPV